MVKSLIVLSALLAHLVLSPAPAAADDAILVSAAMSLRSPFEEIGALFAATTGEPRPAFNFGASGDLALQIRGGAPVDVFAAAAARDMDGLESAAALLPQTRVDFAANAMVLVVPSAANNVASAFADLTKPEIARIAVGNPKTSPAGRYAVEIFESTGVDAPGSRQSFPGSGPLRCRPVDPGPIRLQTGPGRPVIRPPGGDREGGEPCSTALV